MLDFNFFGDARFTGYQAEILDPNGKTKLEMLLPVDAPKDTTSIHVPANVLDEVQYTVLVLGVSAASKEEIVRYPFTLKFQD